MAEKEDTEGDGRRLRGLANRDAIVRAMMELIEAGHVSPSAARVAEVAGVGLRTVYRHFDDLDALYQEMAAIVRADLEPVLTRPLKTAPVHERLEELIHGRVQVYERIMPLKIAANIRRFSSEYLMQDYLSVLRKEEKSLRLALEPVAPVEDELFHSLLIAISFQVWRGLRLDHGHTVEEAEGVVRRMVRSLAKDLC
ncbi:MAG: TetR/AcrR family transcriptional regulator [Pseudomonadota bacterium]